MLSLHQVAILSAARTFSKRDEIAEFAVQLVGAADKDFKPSFASARIGDLISMNLLYNMENQVLMTPRGARLLDESLLALDRCMAAGKRVLRAA